MKPILKKIAIITMITTMLFTMQLAYINKARDSAQALAPAVAGAYALNIARAIAIEVAIDLGWKYIGKPAMDKVTKFVADKVGANLDDFDFSKKKPTKKGKSIEVDVSTSDRAKIASMLKDYGEEIIEADTNRKVTKPKYDVDFVETDPFYNTGLDLDFYPAGYTSSNYEAVDFVRKMYNIVLTPKSFSQQTKMSLVSIIDGSTWNGTAEMLFKGGTPSKSYRLAMYKGSRTGATNVAYELASMDAGLTYNGVAYEYYTFSNTSVTYKAYQKYLRELELRNRTIYMAQGIMLPSDMTKVYDYPIQTPSTYQPPYTLPNPKLTIPLPNSDDSVMELDWSTDSDYELYKVDMDNYYDVKLSEGDTTITNNYDYDVVVNNYYTADDGDKTIEEVKDEITIIIENDIDNGGAGDLTPKDDPIEVPKSFFYNVYEMADQIEDVYEGLTTWAKASVDGMKELTEGTAGLVSFLDEFFDWLPSEYRILLTSGFMLGVISFFLRR